MFMHIPAAGGNAQNVCRRRIKNSSWEAKKDRSRHLSPYIHPTVHSLCLFITDSVQFPWSLHACTKTHTLLHTPINMHAYTMCVCMLEHGTFSHARDINPSNSMHDPFHMCVCLLFQPVYILWAQLIQCCCSLKPPLAADAHIYTYVCTCIRSVFGHQERWSEQLAAQCTGRSVMCAYVQCYCERLMRLQLDI